MFAYASFMPPRKLTPVQVLERLLTRLKKRMEALQRVKLDGIASWQWSKIICVERSDIWRGDGAPTLRLNFPLTPGVRNAQK
jgi:hypothetical protein